MVYASSPTIQSSVPAITLATLRAVLAKGQAAHPAMACRMERAAMIVALRRIEPAVSGQEGCYWVEASDGSREYWVTIDPRGYRGDRCSCPDATKRGNPCKHAVAVRLLQRCLEREGRGPEPPPVALHPAVAPDPDASIPFELTPQAIAALDGAAA